MNLAEAAIELLIDRAEVREERENIQLQHLAWKDRIALTAHDLRNPLTAARLNAQLLSLAASSRTPQQIESIAARILSSLSRADRMISDFLDNVASADAAGPAHLSAGCDAAKVLRETLDGFPLIHSSRFVSALAPDVRGPWDRDALRRATENLLTNAIKYGCPDSDITVSLERAPEKARISVHNSGSPIPIDRQRQLLADDAASSRTEKGWGLGLRLVKQFARLHGGCLLLKSETGTGTTFTVELPLSPDLKVSPDPL